MKFARFELRGKKPGLKPDQRPAASSGGDHLAVRTKVAELIDGEPTPEKVLALTGLTFPKLRAVATFDPASKEDMKALRDLGGHFKGDKLGVAAGPLPGGHPRRLGPRDARGQEVVMTDPDYPGIERRTQEIRRRYPHLIRQQAFVSADDLAATAQGLDAEKIRLKRMTELRAAVASRIGKASADVRALRAAWTAVFASTWVTPEDNEGFAVMPVLRGDMVEGGWDARDGYATGAPAHRVPIALAADRNSNNRTGTQVLDHTSTRTA